MTPVEMSRRRLLGLMGAAALASCGGAWLWWQHWLTPPQPAATAASVPLATMTHPPATELAILPRAAWHARPPDHTARNEPGFYSADNPFGWRRYEGDYRAIYRTLVVHHSVIYERDDRSTLRAVQALHMDDRAWADVGYHYLIGRDGTLYAGRDLAVRGTHVGGFNTGSVGVCLLGDFRAAAPAPAQLASLLALGRWLARELPLTHLAAHRDFTPETQCPGTRLIALLDDLAAALGLARGAGGYERPAAWTPATAGCCCHQCNFSG